MLYNQQNTHLYESFIPLSNVISTKHIIIIKTGQLMKQAALIRTPNISIYKQNKRQLRLVLQQHVFLQSNTSFRTEVQQDTVKHIIVKPAQTVTKVVFPMSTELHYKYIACTKTLLEVYSFPAMFHVFQFQILLAHTLHHFWATVELLLIKAHEQKKFQCGSTMSTTDEMIGFYIQLLKHFA